MANNPFFSDATCAAAVNAVAQLCNSGFIEIYNGTQPADANTAVTTQTLLVTCTFGATAFAGATASGTAPNRLSTAAANTITTGIASGTGTASWFRCYKSDGVTVVFDGSVGVAGCDLNIASTAISQGESIPVTSFTITQPE